MNLIKTSIALPLIELNEAARIKQAELIAASKLVCAGPIKSHAEAESVGIALRDIRTYVKEVTEAGEKERKPIVAAQKQIITIVSDYCAPLTAEQARGERLITDWHEQERQRVEREEAQRQAEIARMQAQQAESQKLAAEVIADPNATIEQIMDAEKFQQDAKADTRAVIVKPVPEARNIDGTSTRRVLDYTVTDEDALYKARPDWFKKPELKKSAVNACYFPNKKATRQNPDTETPGISGFWKSESSVRSW